MLGYVRLLMLLLIPFVYYIQVREWGLQLFLLGAMFVFVVNHFLGFRGKRRFYICMMIDFTVITAFGFIFAPTTLYLILFGVAAVTVFMFTDEKRLLVPFVVYFFVAWFGIVVYTYYVLHRFLLWDNVMNFMFIVFEVLVGSLVYRLEKTNKKVDEQYEKLQRSHEALQEAHQQLHGYAKEVEELTVVRERNQIARDIHDTVGHNMTALLVQLQLVQALSKQGDSIDATLETCAGLARHSLQELRVSVRTLKEDTETQTLLAGIRKVLDEFAKVTAMKMSFTLQGDPEMIPVSLHPTMFRIVQEALTNAKRHGDAQVCEVALHCEDTEVVLVITDNGKGVAKVAPGFGLINMKERVEERGGTISFTGMDGNGFRIEVVFPLREKKWFIGGNR